MILLYYYPKERINNYLNMNTTKQYLQNVIYGMLLDVLGIQSSFYVFLFCKHFNTLSSL